MTIRLTSRFLVSAAVSAAVAAALAVTAAGFAACSGGANNPFGSFDGGGGQDGFILTNSDLATGDALSFANSDLASDVNGPTITITAPAVNMEIPGDALTVTATIVGHGGEFIDGTTVLLEIPSNGPGGLSSVQMTLTAAQDVYQGVIDISSIPSGMSEFTVTAADVKGRRSNVRQNYVHDHGPVITFIQPQRATATGSLYVEIVIDDTLHPLTDASTVKATIHSGDNIMLTQIAGAVPLRVQGTITFSSYSPPLDGTQLLTVSATNSKGTKGQAVKQFTVDNLGPSIAFINPRPGQFIGGVLQIQATIDDISGVNDSSVMAVFGGDTSKEVQLTRAIAGMPEFDGLFDVRQLGTNYVLPTLSIRADDQLGNHSELAEEIVVDNVPPAISLDPPQMYVGLVQTDGVIECTQPFDPVGNAANDLDVVQQIVTLRARVEDRGNFAPGLAVVRVSVVDHNSVFLLGIPASSGALAVDTDGDPHHYCDDVNPLLQPTSNIMNSQEAISVQMAPIPPAGAGDLHPSPLPTPNPGCTQVGEVGGVEPAPLCVNANTDMTLAISYTDASEPAIWTIPPVTATASGCVGFQFDTLNSMPEGPACFAVVARDNAGNHSVSKPLRLCINRSTFNTMGPATGPCQGWPGTAQDCLGTYDKATNMTTGPACSPAPGDFNFAIPELRILE